MMLLEANPDDTSPSSLSGLLPKSVTVTVAVICCPWRAHRQSLNYYALQWILTVHRSQPQGQIPTTGTIFNIHLHLPSTLRGTNALEIRTKKKIRFCAREGRWRGGRAVKRSCRVGQADGYWVIIDEVCERYRGLRRTQYAECRSVRRIRSKFECGLEE
jgi:hypothetical protein